MRSLRSIRRAFTLIETLMASGILLVVVMAVSASVTAGQQHAAEARLRIAGVLACEELLGRLLTEEYDDLTSWNKYEEKAGAMKDGQGRTFPPSFAGVRRRVTVTHAAQLLDELDVKIVGLDVVVSAMDANDRVLVELSRFVPEPGT